MLLKLVLHSLNVFGKYFVLGDDSLTFISESGATSIVVIENVCENDTGNVEVCDCDLVSNKEILTVFKLLGEVSDHLAQVVTVVFLASLVESLLEEYDFYEASDIVVCVVNDRVAHPHLVVLRRVISKLAAHKSQDSE